ncbi:putative AhpC/TSA family protein [Blattamonas nauphoetae]|uniref:AhpC/TSA family protein n=1 Tax=Blattamonas nauphoetae TaxID=2049346 RepID=A0ABQ9WUD9_9EUKA|nr:putative AhpC/TSA family protein [Blattamonas nauphoetae]
MDRIDTWRAGDPFNDDCEWCTLRIVVPRKFSLASSLDCEPSRQRQDGSQPSTHFRSKRSVLERKDVYPARDRLTPPNGHIISFTFSRLEWDDTHIHCAWASLPALNVGDRAKNFVLKNQNGQEISFKDQLGDGPPVVFVNHNGTSLHDSRMLKGFSLFKKQFNAQNAKVFGVSANSEAKIAKTKSKYNLKSDLLSDPKHPVKSLWGIKRKGTHEAARTSIVFSPTAELRKALSAVKKINKKEKFGTADDNEEMDGITTIFEDEAAEQWDDEVDVTEEDRRDTERMLEGLANEEEGMKVKTAKKHKKQNRKDRDKRAMISSIL